MKLNKKLLLLFSLSLIVTYLFPVTTVVATELEQTDFNTSVSIESKEPEEMIDEVAPYIYKNSEGHLAVSDSIPEDIYERNNVFQLEQTFKETNKQVDARQAVVNDDLTITDFTKSTRARGVSFNRYWWGVQSVYTNAATRQAIRDFNYYAAGVGVGSAALAWLPAIGGIGGFIAAYSGLLANRFEANNRGRGVTLNMTWALVYDVKSR